MTSAALIRFAWLIPTLCIVLTLHSCAKAQDSSEDALRKQATAPESEPNESCGINMECVPRRLCRDNVISDQGFSVIGPTIGTTDCSHPLHRCCAVDPKEGK